MKQTVAHATLMRYFDGELSPEEAAAVERQLSSDPEAQKLVQNLDQLGELVRDAAFARARTHDDLIDSVMARLDADSALPASTGADESTRAPTPLRRKALGPQRSPAKVAALVGVSLALAAGAALVLRTNRPPPPAELAVRSPASALVPERAPAEPEPAQLGSAGTESSEGSSASIETVHFGSTAGTIFPGNDEDGEETTPVVWVMDEPGPSPGRMEPL
ncbi:MAG TPA: hypothetical protein VK524_07300 [Polyangiaceae bacterium]|nr:hypothetical protein [Polyangiaceae bacterium]